MSSDLWVLLLGYVFLIWLAPYGERVSREWKHSFEEWQKQEKDMEVELTELNLDGMIDEKGVRYLGSATRRPDGKWVCLAEVNGCLCLVEVKLRLLKMADGKVPVPLGLKDRYPTEDEHGDFPYSNPDLCRGCGKMILPENRRVADGCPCNSPRGINHGLVPIHTCTCVECDPEQTGSTRYKEYNT